jgi:hypothetical protein
VNAVQIEEAVSAVGEVILLRMGECLWSDDAERLTEARNDET